MTIIVESGPVKMPMRSDKRKRIALTSISYFLPVATLGLMVYFSITTRAFLTPGNLLAVITQNTPTFIVAALTAMLLMSGYIDLSIGSNMAVSGVVAGVLFQSQGIIPGILGGLIVGLLFGLLNGYVISYLGFDPIIVTLGLLAAGRGLALHIAPNSIFGFPEEVSNAGSADLFGISYLAIAAIVVVILCMIVMNRFPVGKHVIAIGVNKRAAYLNGIKVRPIVMGLYVAVGLFTSIAALLLIARLDSAPAPSLGLGFEVTVLTAVLLGGVPFKGGRGAIWRVMLGVWLIGILGNGLTLLNIPVAASGMITGGVLVVAAGLEALRFRIRKGS